MLEAKGLLTVEDLLSYVPFRYEDRSNTKTIAQLAPGEMATVVAEVRTARVAGFRRRNLGLFEASFTDASGAVLRAKWFHGEYLAKTLEPGRRLALFGKVEFDNYTGELFMLHPEFELLTDDDEDADAALHVGRVVPVYEGVSKVNTRALRTIVHAALGQIAPLADTLPESIRRQLKLVDRWTAIREAHFPPADSDLRLLNAFRSPAQFRLIFEEFFWLECGLMARRGKARQQVGIAFELTERVRERIKTMLPFKPTAAQKRVLGEIARDMAAPRPMHRLLQGDVGSGKTIVAVEASVIAIENGYQTAMLAPTEILAAQHYLYLKPLLSKLGYVVALLTGSFSSREKVQLKKLLAEGLVHVAVGTHALLEKDVEFHNLGLAIVDEQHRFGVMQRMELARKGVHPDVLVMTATPIPRTLALTLYGDLDVSIIDELPPGRTPITTRSISNERAPEVWDFVRKQVALGRQAYVVYPVIESAGEEGDLLARDVNEQEAETSGTVTRRGNARTQASAQRRFATRRPGAIDPRAPGSARELARLRQTSFKGMPEPTPTRNVSLKSATDMYEELRKNIFPDLRIALLHGRLSSDEKELVMARFQRGDINVLVATTVIEVGVDVPNATVMVIEHAERFGLSQLHQLRGRIGRGSHKSYCVLMTGGKITPQGVQRLDAMLRTQDGFAIAELDLEQRGPGEFFGTKQAGAPSFRAANLIRDRKLLELARAEAQRVVEEKGLPISKMDRNTMMFHLKTHWQRRYGLVEVG